MTHAFVKKQVIKFCQITPLAWASILVFSSPTQAALESRAGGAMIYDTNRDITWVADANLFRTQAAANSSLVSELIAANSSLSTNDFNVKTGAMTWLGASTWANGLDFGGFDDWRLPSVIDIGNNGCDYSLSGTDCGWNVDTSGSEMAHMYYDELGLKAFYDASGRIQNDSGLFRDGILDVTREADIGLVQNIVANYYWYREVYNNLSDPTDIRNGYIWGFGLGAGHQTLSSDTMRMAWAVRDGDITAVPLPGAVWIFGSGLLAILGVKRRVSVG